jgi:hypothetical protein
VAGCRFRDYIVAMKDYRSAIDKALMDQARLASMSEAASLARFQQEMFGGVTRQQLAELSQTASATQRALEDAAKPYGGVAQMMREIENQRRSVDEFLKAPGILEAIEEARRGHWASAFAGYKISDLSKLYGGSLDTVLSSAAEQSRHILSSTPVADAATAAAIKASYPLDSLIAGVSAKMTVIAGVTAVSGVETPAYDAAFHGLLGDWRLRPDLPERFWNDKSYREDRYRRADVDAGLIDVEPQVAVELMISSGLIGGTVEPDGAVALLSFGSVSMAIRATDAEVDAYRVIRSFERRLRDFIRGKLEAHAGPGWLKRRVDGAIVKRATDKRDAALKSGESVTDLLEFTDLGELMEIILRGDNWSDTFEAVFVNRDRFRQDMLTLLALRRPVAHSRVIDSPQLAEAMLVMHRLDARMSGA